MRTQSKIWTVGLSSAALAVAIALVLPLQAREPSVASLSARVAEQQEVVQFSRIVPADALDRSTTWSPLTGDGSN